MTDKLFDDETLLSDPGFDSDLAVTSSDEEREGETASDVAASLFPKAPFLSSADDVAEQVEEPVTSEDRVECEDALQVPAESFADEELFDPAPILSETGAEASLFDMPEPSLESREQAVASDVGEQASAPEEGAVAPTEPQPPSRRARSAQGKRVRGREARPTRPMTPERISAHRRDEGASIRFGKLRLCLVVALTILLAVLEIFPAFGVDVTVALGVSRVRGAAALLDIQLLLLIALCIWRSVLIGFRYLFTRRFRAECLLLIGLVLAFGYNIYLVAVCNVVSLENFVAAFP